MPIDPWLAARFELIRDIPSLQTALADPALGARLQQYLVDPEPWTPPAGITSDDAMAGSVRVRVFRPATATGTALLWMHGGGFVIGSVDDTESVIPASELAARAGAVVVSVDYRLALDGVRYPAPLDDVLEAWRWLGDQGFDRVFIGGASVGATLATAAAVRLRDANQPLPHGMLLGYPVEHYPVPAGAVDGMEAVPPMLRFPLAYQANIVGNYVGRLENLPADAVPGDHDVSGLPEAWIAPAEYDDLRPSADLFARQLAAAGIPVHEHLAAGMPHGFLGRGPSLAAVDAVLDFFAAALR